MEEWIYENRDSARALAEMGLCDHCLGRMFGKIGTGTTNVNRGQDIREALAEEGIEAPAAEFCPLCENVFELLDRFADAAVEAMDGIESDNFLIGTRVEPEIVQREKELWERYGLEQAEPIKAELNREIGKLALPRMHRPVEFKNPQVVALVDTRFADVSVDIAPVFIAGRYNKFSREIPQTIWPCRVCHGKGCDHCHGKGKMYDTSVQEIIGDVALEMTGGREHFFHGMGREDIDARMLPAARSTSSMAWAGRTSTPACWVTEGPSCWRSAAPGPGTSTSTSSRGGRTTSWRRSTTCTTYSARRWRGTRRPRRTRFTACTCSQRVKLIKRQ